MTATLDDVTAKKQEPELTAEEAAAVALVRRAREQGLSLTGWMAAEAADQDGAQDGPERGEHRAPGP